MAIKARAGITITRLVDIAETITYYLFQSSTLAIPSPPTTYPPTSLSKNLFNKDTASKGYTISGSSIVANETYFVSDFIPVVAGKTYITSGKASGNSVLGYTENKQLKATLSGGTSSITIPTGVAYIRTSGLITQLDTYQLELGATASDYMPYAGWTTTEQEYSFTVTNTLYFCDCTVFTNGSFGYSAVSKSSSYEAAKEAYNKAIAAASSATDAKIEAEEARKRAEEASASAGSAAADASTAGAKADAASNTAASAKTEVEKAQQELSDIRQTTDKVNTTFDFAPDGLYIGEGSSLLRLRLANDSMQFLYGVTAQLTITNEAVFATRVEANQWVIGNVVHYADENGDEVVS